MPLMSPKVRRILFIVAAAVMAHFVASYLCMYFTVDRIQELSLVGADRPQKVYVPRRFRVGAPVYVFTLLNAWRQQGVETTKGMVFLWMTYAVPAVGIFALIMLVPKLVTEDEREKAPAAAPAARPGSAAPAAPAATAVPPPRPAVTPPPPARAVTPPAPARTVTPPPPARMPPRPRRPS